MCRYLLLLFCSTILFANASLAQQTTNPPTKKSEKGVAKTDQGDGLKWQKELGSIGIKWNYKEFITYLYENDSLVVSMFGKGGMKLRQHELVQYTCVHFNPRIVKVLKTFDMIDLSAYPTSLNTAFYEFFENIRSQPKKETILFAFGNPLIRTEIQNAIKREEARLKLGSSKDKSIDKSCMQGLEEDKDLPLLVMAEKYYDEASKQSGYLLLAEITYTIRDLIKVELIKGLLLNDQDMMSDKIAFFLKAVKKYCPYLYEQLEQDSSSLDLLKYTLALAVRDKN